MGISIGRRGTACSIAFGACLLLAATLAAQDTPSSHTMAERPHYDGGKFIWPEFRPEVIERGGADEPDIANMGADWSHEMELRVKIDRTEYQLAEPIRVVCDATNVSGANHMWLAPFHPYDRYLQARVRVFDHKGKLRPMTEFYKHEGRQRLWGGSGWAPSCGSSINPGDTFRTDVVPNLIYDMTRPGDYWILVEIPFGSPFACVERQEKELFFLRAQPIKVTVKAQDVVDLNTKPGIHSYREKP